MIIRGCARNSLSSLKGYISDTHLIPTMVVFVGLFVFLKKHIKIIFYFKILKFFFYPKTQNKIIRSKQNEFNLKKKNSLSRKQTVPNWT
jgi:hypothetical protein